MANLEKIVEDLSSLTVLEAAELSKLLEEKWGVSAAAPVAMAAAPAAGGGAAPAEAAEEQTEFTVVLTGGGDKKINVIKEVRSIRPDLGLKEAKDLVEGAPQNVKENISKQEAADIKAKLEAAGASRHGEVERAAGPACPSSLHGPWTDVRGPFAFAVQATQQAARVQLPGLTFELALQALNAAPTAATRWWPAPVKGTRWGTGPFRLYRMPLAVHFHVPQPPCGFSRRRHQDGHSDRRESDQFVDHCCHLSRQAVMT